ncbi:uncharacterized protein E6C27_scaffold108G002120 [Cucumis melo var. makuwa]|uniref:Ubiquitin-like protease family profile domain-containing protein n=2 Tax=Cucumis melo TaxID=3656 RepID=A0A5A7V263_CUCMM|nr:uncharacterized protein E6C27_scaffold108G002120 [Cucumis melo var. makuwa]
MYEENDVGNIKEMVEIAHEQYSKDPSGFEKLLNDDEKPLYEGCKQFTKLSTLGKLYNLKVRHGWSNINFSELLKALKDILPSPNDLPTSMYEAKKMLGALGMEYEKIHACPNDCCLYRKEYANAIVCPECEIDDKLRHPADSPAWKLVDTMWPNFSSQPRNLRLALSADGINPYSDMSSKYSCWSVVRMIYNLPPWLCIKRKFMMLSILVSGPKQPGDDIGIYLEPLIDDLKLLWESGIFLDIPGKTKDGLNARRDLADLKIRPELTPINGEKKNFIPPACYTLTKKESGDVEVSDNLRWIAHGSHPVVTTYNSYAINGYSFLYNGATNYEDLTLGLDEVEIAVIGSGVLSLAWAIAQLGWVAGPRVYTAGGNNVKFCGLAQYGNLVGVSIGYTITASISMVPMCNLDHKRKAQNLNNFGICWEANLNILAKKSVEMLRVILTYFLVLSQEDEILDKAPNEESPNDALTQALGTPEYGGRVRGVGGFITPTVYFHQAKPRKSNKVDTTQQIIDENEVLRKRIRELEQKVQSIPTSEHGSCSKSKVQEKEKFLENVVKEKKGIATSVPPVSLTSKKKVVEEEEVKEEEVIATTPMTKNEVKSSRPMTKEVEVTSEPSNLPIQLKYILRYAERVMVDGSSFSFQLPLELFGISRKSYVLREDVIDFCNMQKVKTLSMVAYITYLYSLIIDLKKVSKYVFVDPSLISAGHSTREIRAQNLCSRLMTSKQDQLVVAPYNPGDHWSLVIINPYDDVVYHLDSLRTSSRDDIKYVGTVECGYYVMRYMREIVSKDTSIITDAIYTRNSYS